MRDFPNSPYLMRNMCGIVKKVSSREFQGMEQELLLYKGPIPYRCIPTPEEPESFFNVEQ